MEKLKLINVSEKELDFIVEIPKICKYPGSPTIVRIKRIKGEFRYVPRKHTFAKGVSLTMEELQAIRDKLKELNK